MTSSASSLSGLQVRAVRLTMLLLSLAAPLATVSAQPSKTPPPSPPRQPAKAPPKDTLTSAERTQLREASRDARSLARRRLGADSVTRRLRADSAAASAFATPDARTILERARRAREIQDSSLTAYRATTTQRMSVAMGVRRVGLEKLLFRGDNVADIAWKRGVGVWVNPIGSRMTVPMASKVSGDMVSAVSIPYFPGRETLWFPSSDFGVVRSDIDEREMIHPLARGAEYYYRYETGDSISIRLDGGRVIRVRELRIIARRPEYRLFVGSFWFDQDGGQLVRAAYRMAADLEIWDVANAESRIEQLEDREAAVVRDSIARARLPRDLYVKDSTERARVARRQGSDNEDEVPGWVSGTFRPAKAKLDAISVEYGLYQGRFWLPRANSATASVLFGPMRVPVRIDEKFTYSDVNGDFTLPALPPPRTRSSSADSMAADSATRRDSIQVNEVQTSSVSVSVGPVKPRTDSASRSRTDSIRLARMPAYKRVQCAKDSVYTRTETRYEGALRIAYSMPCNEDKLTTSTALPEPYAPDEELFDVKSRDELLASLDLSLQPALAPQRPTIRTGSDLLRFNRIEGLSVGVQATQVLGAGYTASAIGRIGYADLHANGELSLARSNGRRTVTGTVFHRLNATNPEWAGGLSFAASLPAALYARDEGFYYRSYGVELGEKREQRRGALEYRIFTERQWTAGDSSVRNTLSLGRIFGDRRFRDNFISEPLAVTGVAGSWSRAFGNNPKGFQLASITRAEAGTGTFTFARGSWEGTLTRPIGGVAAALTGSAGSSVGDLPAQRGYYLGGLRTVRGQLGGTQRGDAFWLGRAELGWGRGAFRPVVFYDEGWAGSRAAFGKSQSMRGAGFGFGLLDGLLRLDVARGLNFNKRWRTDLYFGAPL